MRTFSVKNWLLILDWLMDRPGAPEICALYITLRQMTDPLLAMPEKSVAISFDQENEQLVMDAAFALGIHEKVWLSSPNRPNCPECLKKFREAKNF